MEYDNAIVHHAQRITALEDLLRRNEDSLGTVLGRMKDAELALNNFHHALTKIGPEVAVHSEEVHHVKRKLEIVDQAWQSKAREIDDVVSVEIRGANARGVSTGDPTISRMTIEMKAMHGDLQETIAQVRRLSEVSAADGKLTKQNFDEMKWIADQMREHGGNFRDVITAQESRNQRYEQQMGMMKKEVEGALSGVKQLIDAVVTSTSDEIIARVETEAKKRGILQSEVGSVVTSLREEFSTNFSDMAGLIQRNEESHTNLETVLRAEIKSRIASNEQSVKRLEVVEDRLRSEALGAAHYLKDLDAQVARALQDVQEVTSQDSRMRIEAMQKHLSAQIAHIARDVPSRGDMEDIDARLNVKLDNGLQGLRAEAMSISQSQSQSRAVSKHGGDGGGGGGGNPKFERQQQVHNQETNDSLSAMGGTLEKAVQRIEDSEQKTVIVAEALKDVHEDLVEKFERVEAQSMAVDALVKSLEQNFERDQEAMARQVRTLRSQLQAAQSEGNLGKAEEKKKSGEKGDNSTTDKGGDDTDFFELQRQLSEMRRGYDRDVAELKARVEQMTSRVSENEKGMQDELSAIRAETNKWMNRMENTDVNMADKIRATTSTTNQNFNAIEQNFNELRLEVERLGTALSTRGGGGGGFESTVGAPTPQPPDGRHNSLHNLPSPPAMNQPPNHTRRGGTGVIVKPGGPGSRKNSHEDNLPDITDEEENSGGEKPSSSTAYSTSDTGQSNTQHTTQSDTQYVYSSSGGSGGGTHESTKSDNSAI